jgi:hypothetical protein
MARPNTIRFPKYCLQCKIEFQAYERQVFCSTECHHEFYRKQAGKAVHNGASTGVVGAIAELAVSTHLMSRGYEVYRALSPASSCDLIALKNKETFTIEVRSGLKTFDGNITYGKQRIRADIIAVYVHATEEIILIPELGP